MNIAPAEFLATSHPAWGAWIEMRQVHQLRLQLPSHPAWGAWIEIVKLLAEIVFHERRTPHGVRGLKCNELVKDPDSG